MDVEACNALDDDCDGVVDEGCGSFGDGTCAAPWLVTPGGGTYTNTMNGWGTLTAPCGDPWNSGGVERVYSWTPATTGTATVTVTGDYWPSTAYVSTGGLRGVGRV